MYDQLRIQLQSDLLSELNCDQVKYVLQCLDKAMQGKTITESALIPYKDEVPDLVKLYAVSKSIEGHSELAIKYCTLTLCNLISGCGKDVKDITANDIRLWMYRYKQERGISDRTLDKYRTDIKTFFNWCKREEYISSNPCEKVPRIRSEQKQRQSLTQEEIELLRCSCGSCRESAMLEFMFSTGCRVSEMIIVKLSDLNMRDHTVALFGKGKKHRTSFLNAKAMIAINNYLKERKGDSEYLFCGVRSPYAALDRRTVEKIFTALGERANLESGKMISPHIIRHSTATIALENGMPVNEIQQLLGHSSINTTMIYAQTNLDKVKDTHRRTVI